MIAVLLGRLAACRRRLEPEQIFAATRLGRFREPVLDAARDLQPRASVWPVPARQPVVVDLCRVQVVLAGPLAPAAELCLRTAVLRHLTRLLERAQLVHILTVDQLVTGAVVGELVESRIRAEIDIQESLN